MLGGVAPVLQTPFDAAERVDEAGFAAMLDAVIGAGCRAAMFPGFASEFAKLTDAEREALTSLFLARAAGESGFSAIVSVPDHATVVAARRTHAAVTAGAAAINVLPPHFLSPSRAAVLEHLREVLRAAGETPVIVQLAPALTGSSLDVEAIAALAQEFGNLAWVKVETVPPGRTVAALAALDPPVPSMVGYAGVQLLDALRRGVAGVQPGCSFPELYLRIWSLWQDGREAEAAALHARLLPYIAYWMLDPELIVAAEKLISVRRGWFSSPVCRRPGWQLDAQERARVGAFLDEFAAELGPPA